MKIKQIAPNQFFFEDNGRRYFQSYNSVIACKNVSGGVELDKNYWDYSKTTGRYRNQFLGEDKKETLKKIASGQYTLVNLN